MKKLNVPIMLVAIGMSSLFYACSNEQKSKDESNKNYETVANDPTDTRIYTLENGLKVYLSVNKEKPRINTAIAVRAGSKNDPATATGLAHYLEHMLFKGTDKYGTLDYEKEAPLLNQIDSLYEVYRATEDKEKRKSIYADIDSTSQLASKYAIANEYDKMVSELGAQGTNAYTSFEQTVYVNDIPSNQIGRWLQIEAERFRNPQFRLFHTELEAVYEEKNRSLDSDFRKAWYATFDALFPNHQYGQQTTIGTIEHLKNPSLKEIKKYFNKYYVPNNMAICMSGDFNPDSVIAGIKENFGGMEAKDVPEFKVTQEEPITEVIEREVYGPDAEFMYMGYRFDGEGSKDADLVTIADMILSNQSAGLIDLNLNQEQKVLSASSFSYVLDDYSTHIFNGRAKEGQSLEEVRDLLLAQIDSLKAGNFPDWLMDAIINDMKLSEIKRLENNWARTDKMVDAFIVRKDWEDVVSRIDELDNYSKEDVIEFAKANYKENYALVYKRTGEDSTVKSVEKPNITPIEVNRENSSDFLAQMSDIKAAPIAPVFLDYKAEIEENELANGITVRSVENTDNDLFTLYYVFEMGSNNKKKLSPALEYLEYLGTSKYSPAEIKQEFYKIGCEYYISAGDERVYVYLSGLNENFEEGLKLFEHLLAEAQVNEEAWKNLVSDILKQRANDKLSKSNILFNGLYNYAQYGAENPFKNVLTEEELKALNPQELVNLIHSLNDYEHRILYYGPLAADAITKKVTKMHQTADELKAIPEGKDYAEQSQDENKVYWVDYDMEQAEIIMLSKKKTYDPKTAALANIYNEYFGGGMGSIVFQEMRESKALAYSVYSSFSSPADSTKAHYVMAYIGTQADKLEDAMAGMTDLLNNMPESQKSFELAKKAALEKIRTQRITKTSKLWSYETALRRGLDYDLRKDIYDEIPELTMEDLKAFHEQYVKGGDYDIVIIGDEDKLDFEVLKNYGPTEELSLTQVFGY
jgi:predicted Zn-dependent peptidase